MARVIVLDASVLIAYLDAHDDHHVVAEAMLSAAAAESFGISTLTLAEVLVAPARQGQLPIVLTALRGLDVEEIPMPEDAALRLANLRASARLKMPDCCVVLATQQTGARLASFDTDLIRAAQHLQLPVLSV